MVLAHSFPKMQPTIHSINAKVVEHQIFYGQQFILTLHAPEIANNTLPGQFVHIQCDKGLLMRRPISIMSTNKDKGEIDLLYKVVGEGTKLLSKAIVGQLLPTLGPIGNGFALNSKKRPLLLGGGVGMPPMIAIAQVIKDNQDIKPLAILASEVPFPFEPILSQIPTDYTDASHTMPLIEGWGIACRLTSLQGYEGVYQGFVTALAEDYLQSLSKTELSEVEIFACGPHPMLEAVAKLAKKYQLPAQVSLEETMACAVGGCAGCVVKVVDNGVESMKRVCVDGPVFEASTVF